MTLIANTVLEATIKHWETQQNIWFYFTSMELCVQLTYPSHTFREMVSITNLSEMEIYCPVVTICRRGCKKFSTLSLDCRKDAIYSTKLFYIIYNFIFHKAVLRPTYKSDWRDQRNTKSYFISALLKTAGLLFIVADERISFPKYIFQFIDFSPHDAVFHTNLHNNGFLDISGLVWEHKTTPNFSQRCTWVVHTTWLLEYIA